MRQIVNTIRLNWKSYLCHVSIKLTRVSSFDVNKKIELLRKQQHYQLMLQSKHGQSCMNEPDSCTLDEADSGTHSTFINGTSRPHHIRTQLNSTISRFESQQYLIITNTTILKNEKTKTKYYLLLKFKYIYTKEHQEDYWLFIGFIKKLQSPTNYYHLSIFICKNRPYFIVILNRQIPLYITLILMLKWKYYQIYRII